VRLAPPSTRRHELTSARATDPAILGRTPQIRVSAEIARAPKARPIPAWGEAPCWATPDVRGLKARSINLSIPQILLVAFHSILLQECPKLILEIPFPMMCLLSIDVLNQGLQIRRPNGKRAITPLPCEVRQRRRLRLQPLRRCSLQLGNQLSDIRSSRQSNCKMNVVRNSIDAITLTSRVSRDCREIAVEIATHSITQHGRSSLRTEDYMHHNERERQWHRQQYRSGLQPSHVTPNTSWGYAPCWYSDAPSAPRRGAITNPSANSGIV